jgi:MFS family permease
MTNPFEPPRSTVADMAARAPGHPVKAVLLGFLLGFLCEAIIGVALYLFFGDANPDGKGSGLSHEVYAAAIVLGLFASVLAGHVTATIAYPPGAPMEEEDRRRTYWLAGATGLLSVSLGLAIGAMVDLEHDGFEAVLDVFGYAATIPAVLFGAWLKLRKTPQ